MAAAVSLGSIAQTFDPLLRAVRVAADETWIAPAILDRAAADARLRDLVLPHLERPAPLCPALLYAPFWRVKLAVTGLGLNLAPAARTIAIANIEFPMPMRSFGGRAGVLMISARSDVPYTPRLPAFFGGTSGDALEVQRSDLVPLTNDIALASLREGEIIDADVDRERGERTAVDSLVAMLESQSFESRVESSTFVLYPLWHVAFGDERRHHVMLSARDGKVVSARYPRPPTISERVKRFFTP